MQVHTCVLFKVKIKFGKPQTFHEPPLCILVGHLLDFTANTT